MLAGFDVGVERSEIGIGFVRRDDQDMADQRGSDRDHAARSTLRGALSA